MRQALAETSDRHAPCAIHWLPQPVLELGAEAALRTLVQLDRDKKLLSRDIVAIDLRLPDRVTVRLSDEAYAARAEALKPQKPRRKGGDA